MTSVAAAAVMAVGVARRRFRRHRASAVPRAAGDRSLVPAAVPSLAPAAGAEVAPPGPRHHRNCRDHRRNTAASPVRQGRPGPREHRAAAPPAGRRRRRRRRGRRDHVDAQRDVVRQRLLFMLATPPTRADSLADGGWRSLTFRTTEHRRTYDQNATTLATAATCRRGRLYASTSHCRDHAGPAHLREFDGVMANSSVYINGNAPGHAAYGYVSFRYENHRAGTFAPRRT